MIFQTYEGAKAQQIKRQALLYRRVVHTPCLVKPAPNQEGNYAASRLHLFTVSVRKDNDTTPAGLPSRAMGTFISHELRSQLSGNTASPMSGSPRIAPWRGRRSRTTTRSWCDPSSGAASPGAVAAGAAAAISRGGVGGKAKRATAFLLPSNVTTRDSPAAISAVRKVRSPKETSTYTCRKPDARLRSKRFATSPTRYSGRAKSDASKTSTRNTVSAEAVAAEVQDMSYSLSMVLRLSVRVFMKLPMSTPPLGGGGALHETSYSSQIASLA